ncbi:MAG: hypothetical protein PVS2B1_11030 [Candidatus Dormibacteraceae bacterium]
MLRDMDLNRALLQALEQPAQGVAPLRFLASARPRRAGAVWPSTTTLVRNSEDGTEACVKGSGAARGLLSDWAGTEVDLRIAWQHRLEQHEDRLLNRFDDRNDDV